MKKIIIAGAILAVIAAAGVSSYLLNRPSEKSVANKSSAGVKSVQTPVSTKTEPSKSASSDVIPLPPKSLDQDKAIQDIRRQLQNVMDLNNKINAVQQSKSAQLSHIQEQATVHQKILAEIQRTVDDKKPAVPAREALLSQEKLRIIREESLRNKKAIEDRPSTKTAL